MKIDYTQKTNKTFEQCVSDVVEQVAKHGFMVLHIHNVQATLKIKGIDIKPFKIIEFCNATSANEIISKDINSGLLLPCKINVYQKDESVFINAFLPTAISAILDESQFNDLPAEIEKIIKDIVDKAK